MYIRYCPNCHQTCIQTFSPFQRQDGSWGPSQRCWVCVNCKLQWRMWADAVLTHDEAKPSSYRE